MHFRTLKMIATSGFFTALECTKFVFAGGWGRWRARSAPSPLAGLKGPLLLRERGREGKGRRKVSETKEARRISYRPHRTDVDHSTATGAQPSAKITGIRK